MSEILVCALDRDVAGHLAVALRRHTDALSTRGMAIPPALVQITEMALGVVNSAPEASGSVSDHGQAEDGLHEREFLSRADVERLTGASLATIDRWIASGQLPASKRGRTRRIARADLDAFLRPA